MPSALQGYTVAAHLGNVLAMHRLGHMHQRALGVASRSCVIAAQYFRAVVTSFPCPYPYPVLVAFLP